MRGPLSLILVAMSAASVTQVPAPAPSTRGIEYNLCAPAKGEERKAAYRAIEQSLSTKADLVSALKAAIVYCDGAYATLSMVGGAELVPGTWNRTRFGMLNWNVWHTWEHYGNIVVYLRLKGIVPPSSEKSHPTGE